MSNLIFRQGIRAIAFGDTYALWYMDSGVIYYGKVYERYVGLRGQTRIGLVDELGYVQHIDIDDLVKIGVAD